MKRIIDQKIGLPKTILPKTILIVELLLVFLPLASSDSAKSQPYSQNSASQNETARARELIKLARAAIGGEEALSRIQTITATGKYNRFVKYLSVQSPKKVEQKQKALPGKMQFEFALPDRFRRRVTGAVLRGFDYSFAQVVNGVEAWRDPPMRPISSSGDRRVIDVGDVERTAFIQATSAKQELSYFSIGWLMLTLPGYPLEMSYLGLYQLGAEETHAIIAQGTSGFRFTLLLDTKTYALVALVISFVEEIQPVCWSKPPVFSAGNSCRRPLRGRAPSEKPWPSRRSPTKC
jgi:hypothetical protein